MCPIMNKRAKITLTKPWKTVPGVIQVRTPVIASFRIRSTHSASVSQYTVLRVRENRGTAGQRQPRTSWPGLEREPVGRTCRERTVGIGLKVCSHVAELSMESLIGVNLGLLLLLDQAHLLLHLASHPQEHEERGADRDKSLRTETPYRYKHIRTYQRVFDRPEWLGPHSLAGHKRTIPSTDIMARYHHEP